MIYVYQYRIYPTINQTLELNYWLRVGQYWYNRQLGERFDWWDMNRCHVDRCPIITSIASVKDKPSRYSQSGQLPSLKKTYQFVQSTKELLDFSRVPANTLQAVCKQVEESFSRFIKGDKNGKKSGRPRFKSKNRFKTLYFTGAQKGKFVSTGYFGHYVITKKLGEIKVRMHRPIPDGSTIKTSSITKKADGWYLNVTLDDPTIPVLPKEDATWDNSLGIDAVLKDDVYLALSNGETIKSVKSFRVNESSLAKISKAKELAKKGSRKRRKLARKQAKFHQTIARVRKQHRYDTAHKIVDSGAKNIFVEDLNLQGLSKRNKAKLDDSGKYLPNGQSAKSGLNKSWSDAAFGMFFDTLTAVAEKAGVSVTKVNPAYTSQVLCYRNEITFPDTSVREYFDEELGLIIDRDISAALNIKQRGLQVFPVPRKVLKQKAHRTRRTSSAREAEQEGVQIQRDLNTSIVTAMIDVFKTMNQAHVHNI